ncbi:hypothetical protein ACWD00_40540 [Streptomyces viridiviolaceus]
MTNTDSITKVRRAASPPPAILLSAFVLLALHVAGGYFVFLAIQTTSAGPHDDDFPGIIQMMVLLSIATEVIAAALTAVFISFVGLRKWWFVLSAGISLTAVVRLLFVFVV